MYGLCHRDLAQLFSEAWFHSRLDRIFCPNWTMMAWYTFTMIARPSWAFTVFYTHREETYALDSIASAAAILYKISDALSSLGQCWRSTFTRAGPPTKCTFPARWSIKIINICQTGRVEFFLPKSSKWARKLCVWVFRPLSENHRGVQQFLHSSHCRVIKSNLPYYIRELKT